MILFGASGHAKVIIDILESQGEVIDGIFDDNKNITELSGYPVNTCSEIQGRMIISIGDNKIRKQIRERYPDVEYGIGKHINTLISRFSTIGVGTVLMHGAIVQAGTEIGQHCIINTGATVDHDCRIQDFVHIAPKVTLCGDVSVGEGTLLGAGAVVIQGVKIGKWCVVGAGSVVVKDIPDHAVVVGNPARIIRYK